ncbi:MAG: hypothetical protein ACU836_19005 [Gammaproteobacteria bacterium]
MTILETLVLGGLIILLLFWMVPGIKGAIERGKQTPADWKSVILPIGLVALFVLFLIATV